MTGRITSRITASRSSPVSTSGSCCVLTTTVSTETGRSFSYSTLTWAFPSGRTQGRMPQRLTRARRWVSACA